MSRYAEELKIESPNPAIGHVHVPARSAPEDVDVADHAGGCATTSTATNATARRSIPRRLAHLRLGGCPGAPSLPSCSASSRSRRRPRSSIRHRQLQHSRRSASSSTGARLPSRRGDGVLLHQRRRADAAQVRWWWFARLRVATSTGRASGAVAADLTRRIVPSTTRTCTGRPARLGRDQARLRASSLRSARHGNPLKVVLTARAAPARSLSVSAPARYWSWTSCARTASRARSRAALQARARRRRVVARDMRTPSARAPAYRRLQLAVPRGGRASSSHDP